MTLAASLVIGNIAASKAVVIKDGFFEDEDDVVPVMNVLEDSIG